MTLRCGFFLVLLFFARATMAQDPVELRATLLPLFSDVFLLTPASMVASRPVVIDSTQRADILVTALSPALDVTLVSPKKTRYKVGHQRNGFESFVSVVEDLGANYRAILTDPTPGTWTLEVSAKSLTAPLDIIVNVFIDSAVFTAMFAGDHDYRVGDFAAVALATFRDSTTVRPVTVTAAMTSPTGITVPVSFRDDGTEGDATANDGQYLAIVELTEAGNYSINAVVTGDAGGPFRRTASAHVRANRITGKLTGSFFDNSVDEDADGLFDVVTITPAVEIFEAANYRIRVRLRSASGETMERSMDVDLSPGSAHPTLRFPARDLTAQLRADGPYEVALIALERWADDDVVLVDRRFECGKTDSYRLADAQRDRLRLTGPVMAQGVDTNGNGLFDQLRVTAQFETDVAGLAYWCAAGVNDETYQYEEQVGFRCAVGEGTNTIEFLFDGTKIGATSAGGELTLDLDVSGPMNTLVESRYFSLGRIDPSNFEGALPDTASPSLIVTTSPHTLWPPDHRMVEIIPEIRVTDDRDLAPVVRLESITIDRGEDGRGDGHTSPDVRVENGRIWLRAERNGSEERIYWITWSATDKAGNRVESPALVRVPHDRSQ